MRSHRSGKGKIALIAIIYAALFTVLCVSGPLHESDEKETIFGEARVKLSIGELDRKTETISGSINRDDLSMLGYFTALKTADFRGSQYTEEMAAWAKAHPSVATQFSVPMPDGRVVDNTVTALDVSSYGGGDIAALLDSLAYLDKLSLLKLGDLGNGGFDAEDLSAISAAAPNAKLDFTFFFKGQSVSPDAKSLDLSDISAEDMDDALSLLSCLKELDTLTLNPALSQEDALKLLDCAPDTAVDFSFDVYGRTISLSDTELDFSYVEMKDDGAQLARILPHMKALTKLDMDTTGVSYEALEKMREDNPNVDIIFRIWFGKYYSVRTDAERILASKPTVGGMVEDDTAVRLEYCTKVKFLDLGHNDVLSTSEFLKHMPDLEAVILAMTDISDISGLAGCKNLNYLELNTCPKIKDLSPLAACTELRDLNLAGCTALTDISPLYDIPLNRLWIGAETPVPAEQVAEFKARQPQCKVNTTTVDPHGDYWRFTRYDPEEPKYYWVPRYEQLRHEMGYNYQEYSFYWLDPKCDKPAPPEFAGKYGKEVYG